LKPKRQEKPGGAGTLAGWNRGPGSDAGRIDL